MNDHDVLVIGAGISGLLCATVLKRAGASVVVVDKGRGVGGRMATRRFEGARIDHGAQYFTVRDAAFQSFVDEWMDAGIIREWFRKLPEDSNEDGYPRYCGVRGMSDVGKYLARDLEVHSGERVTELSRVGGRWIARTVEGRVFSAAQLVVTVPLPQAFPLLDSSGLKWAGADELRLRGIRYEKGMALLALLDGPSGLPEPGGMKVQGAPLTWLADNRQKGISPDVHAVTVHADADFAEANWNEPDSVRGPLLVSAAQPFLAGVIVDYQVHRWGFTLPVNPWHEPFFQNRGLGLTLAGDAFGGARVEGAALSGLAAAGQVLGSLKVRRPAVA